MSSSVLRRQQSVLGWLLSLPAVALFGIYFIWPLIRAFQISFYNYTGLGPVEDFAGASNYLDAITDTRLWFGLGRNAFFAAINIAGCLVVGSFLAFQLFRKIRGWKFLQITIFIPHILPVAVVALLWRFVLQPSIGLLDSTLGQLGVTDESTLLLGEPNTALPAVAFVWAWTLIPLSMLILFVSMLRVPEELLEAARIDGASENRILRSIVLPAIKPTLWLVAAFVFITSFRSFDLIYLMTRGGPGQGTETAALYMYKTAFEFNNYGYASALGFIIALFLVIVLPFAARQMNEKVG